MAPPSQKKKPLVLFYKLPGTGEDKTLPFTVANLNRAIFSDPEKPLLRIIEEKTSSPLPQQEKREEHPVKVKEKSISSKRQLSYHYTEGNKRFCSDLGT